ncbi:MAG: transglycosylase SLT domain-containing protein [Caldilineaceae bacterium]|nr:transglycosylase SLT domain-containing protein [Caldilineaceae bacterium]
MQRRILTNIGFKSALLGLGLLLLAGCGRAEATVPTPAPVAAVPTFTATPTPASGAAVIIATPLVLNTPTPAEPVVSPTETPPAPTEPSPATPSEGAGAETSPTIIPPAQAPAGETPQSMARLAQGLLLHRFGDYVAARAEFAAVINAADSTVTDRLHARYELARSYLAEGLFGEAVATLEQFDQERVAAGLGDQWLGEGEFAATEEFLLGEALRGQGRHSEAIAAYWRFLDAHPWMAEAVQPRIGLAYRALGDHAAAAVAYRRAADAATESVARLRLYEAQAESHSAARDYAAAVVVYDEILAVAQIAAYRSQIQYLAGQALASAGDLPGATARWRAATDEAPEARSAHNALIEIVNRNIEFDLYQRGYINLSVGSYQPAINAYRNYLDLVGPTDTRYAAALVGLGQAYLGARSFAEALPVFERVIAEHPDCDCIGQAWLGKAAAQAGLGDGVGARRTYRTYAREAPDDPLAVEALWRSGMQALGEGNQLEAATDFLTLADAFPASERAPAALYAIGLGAMQTGLYSQAVEIYARLQRDYPQYRWDAVGYWLGRAHEAHGDTAQRQAQWQALVERAPDIYYGILAGYGLRQQTPTGGATLTSMARIAGPATRLAGDDGSQAFAERWLNGGLQAAGDLSALPPAIAEDQDLRAARLLLALDQRGDALPFLDRVYQRHRDDPRSLYAMSLAFEQMGAYRLSIVAMARLLEFSPAQLVEDAPIFLQQRSFPRPFRDLIDRAARAHNLSPLLYYSLIRQESLFEEGARSSAAAQGLAQIIPATGQWIAQQLGHPEYTNDIIYRPHINVFFGAYYLDWVRSFADGNLVSALVGYNAGPGNIAGWRSRSGADDALFVEVLTFGEPRLYVQLVTSNLYHYTRLYGE